TAAETAEFFTALGLEWPLTRQQQDRLVPVVAAALAAGWEPRALAEFAGGNTTGVRSPDAVLTARLSAAELPSPSPPTPRRPPCAAAPRGDPATRFLPDEPGYPGPIGGCAVPCPRCGVPAARQRAPAVAEMSG